jgi:hypothetical protein
VLVVAVTDDWSDPAPVMIDAGNESRQQDVGRSHVEEATSHGACRNLGPWDEQVADQAWEEHLDRMMMTMTQR